MASFQISKSGLSGRSGPLHRVLLWVSVAFVVLSCSLIGWISYDRAYASMRAEMSERLLNIACLTAQIVSHEREDGTAKGSGKLQKVLDSIRTVNHLENLFVFDRELRSIADARPTVNPGTQYSMLQLEQGCVNGVWSGRDTVSGRRGIEGIEYLSAYAGVKTGATGAVAAVYAETDTSFLNPMDELRKTIGLIGITVLVLTAVHIMLLRRLLLNLEHSHDRVSQWERFAFVSKVGAEVAHEIKNPLGIIRATADCLKRKYDPSAKDERFSYIAEEVDRLNQITSRMGAFANEPSGSPEPLDVAQLARDILGEVARDPRFEGMELKSDLEAGLPPLILDRSQMKQVFLNLLINARQSQGEKGVISVRICKKERRRSEVIVISVEDRGRGMRKNEIRKAFEPFYTTRPKGSGLGLSIVLHIVEDHGGSIRVRSAPGRGTSVDIIFPCVARRDR